jgi:hypothetical protein
MDILKRIDHAQQFCKFYADGAYSVEKEKWNYHVTPEFIKDIRQYIESLQLKLMHLQKQQAEPCIGKDPRCPCQDGDACHYKDCGGTKARTVAQPEQEPVAYYHPHKGFYWAKPTHISAPTVVDVPPVPLYVKWKAAQRPWQGLTDEEITEIYEMGLGVRASIETALDKIEERNT